MVGTDVFRRTIEILTRQKSDYVTRFLHEKYIAGRDLEAMDFMGQVCGECQATIKISSADAAPFTCTACGSSTSVASPHYWMYYIPLIALKLRTIQPDVALLGSDYVEPHRGMLAGMRHSNSLEAILDFYDLLPGGRPLRFILPPVLLGRDGQKMSKSLGNISEVAYSDILDACAGSQDRAISL